MAETPIATTRNDWDVDRYDRSDPYPDSLYDYDHLATGVNGFEAVGADQSRQFNEQGYFVIHDAIGLEMIEGVKAAIADLITGKNPKFDGTQLESRATLTDEICEQAVRKLMRFCHFDPRLDEIADYPTLTSLVTKLLGDIPIIYQEMALLKSPGGREKPWHQDKAYFDVAPEHRLVGVWIALDDATIENGCMRLMPGFHRDGPIVHFKRRDWQICDTDIKPKNVVAVPMKAGACLIFDSLLPHGTPTNTTSSRRRAIQFHYVGKSTPRYDEQSRLAIFGSEGKDVTC